jgi:hypothetical protein
VFHVVVGPILGLMVWIIGVTQLLILAKPFLVASMQLQLRGVLLTSE